MCKPQATSTSELPPNGNFIHSAIHMIGVWEPILQGSRTEPLWPFNPALRQTPLTYLSSSEKDRESSDWLVQTSVSMLDWVGPGLPFIVGLETDSVSILGLKEFKLWSCLPEVPQQQWFYTADNHLAIYNGPGLCATYAGGGCSRIYCFPGISTCSSETYQQWVLTSVGSPPPSPVVKSVNIHPNNNFDLCLAPNGPDVYTQVDGTPMNVATCSYGSRFFSLQLWDVPAKGTFGPIKMKNKDLCLDAGSTPLQNGRGLKLWTCYDGLYQQSFFRTEDDHLAIYNDVQCADVKREDGTTLQTWQCSGNNPQQIFVVGPEF